MARALGISHRKRLERGFQKLAFLEIWMGARMTTYGMNVKRRVKKRMLMKAYRHCGTLMRKCHKNYGKNCLINSEDEEEKTILKVLDAILWWLKIKTKNNFVLFFEPELGV